MDASGTLEMTCYKKLGVEEEKESSDEYKVLSDVSPRSYEYVQDTGDDLPVFEKREYVDVGDGIRIDTTLIEPGEVPIPIKPDISTLESQDKTYIN